MIDLQSKAVFAAWTSIFADNGFKMIAQSKTSNRPTTRPSRFYRSLYNTGGCSLLSYGYRVNSAEYSYTQQGQTAVDDGGVLWSRSPIVYDMTPIVIRTLSYLVGLYSGWLCPAR